LIGFRLVVENRHHNALVCGEADGLAEMEHALLVQHGLKGS